MTIPTDLTRQSILYHMRINKIPSAYALCVEIWGSNKANVEKWLTYKQATISTATLDEILDHLNITIS